MSPTSAFPGSGRLAQARAEWGSDEFRIECIRRFDDEVDDLAEARPSFARAWIPFDSASLEWRAESMASVGRGRVLDRVYVRHRRSEALVGYGLLRTRTMDRIVGQPYRDVRATTLVDHFVSSLHPAANLALAAHVLAVAQREKSHVAEVVATDVDMTRALRAAFRKVGGFSLSFLRRQDFGRFRPAPRLAGHDGGGRRLHVLKATYGTTVARTRHPCMT
ncbi:MAG: hypothetical protein U0169_26935 [Polyangiaceae bacterium]